MPLPGRRRAPTAARRPGGTPWCGWPRSRHGSRGRAGIRRTSARTGPPTQAPARSAPGPEGPCRRSRECRAGDGARCSWAHTPAGPAGASTRPRRAAASRPDRPSPGQHDHAVDPGRLAASVDLRHPPHAHQRVAAGTEHQLLQVADLLQVPGLRCREDPLPQPPYVLLDLAASPRGPSPGNRPPVRSPRQRRRCRARASVIGVQLAPRFRRHGQLFPAGSPDPRQHPFRPGQPPLSGQLCGNRRRRSQHPVPGFLLPFGRRRSLLGSSCARWGIPPSSRSAYRQATAWTPSGLSRSACVRYDRGGCPLYPGDGGALPAGNDRPAGTRRFPAASPYLPLPASHPAGVLMTRRHRRFTHVHPSGLPQPVTPGWNEESLGTSPGFAPRGYPQRTPRRGRSSRTGPGTTSRHQSSLLRRVPPVSFS